MPRKIGENLTNELKTYDPVSESVIVFQYRLPTTEERVQYGRDSIELVEGKLQTNSTKARQKWGAEILLGFSEGSFQKKVGDKWLPFSSDPKSPDYDPEWKSIVQKYASDLTEALAQHAFEGVRTIGLQGEVSEKN